MKKQKICKVTHALTKNSYPSLPHLASDFKIGDEIKVSKIIFRNGEHHVIGFINGKQHSVPLTWTDLKAD